MPKVLLIQGANMEWLGKRQPEIYGTTTAEELDKLLLDHASEIGLDLEIFYTNVEGHAISRIYEAARSGLDGLVMNPAGFLYAGYALKDCILGVNIPYVEVHMTNIEKRGKNSVLADCASAYITGFGIQSYVMGLDALKALLEPKQT